MRAYPLTRGLTGTLPEGEGSGNAPPYLLPADVLQIGNSYTQNDPFWTPTNSMVQALAVQAGVNLKSDLYASGGRSFRTNYEDPGCIAKIGSKPWSHAVLQDLSTGATGTALADHVEYGNLMARKCWEANPECRIILRETPAYAVGHVAYTNGTYANPDDMISQIQAGYETCRRNLRSKNPGRYPAKVARTGTLIRALGGNLPPAHPSYRSFHHTDFTHPNPNRAWLEACCLFTLMTGLDATPYIAGAVTNQGVPVTINAQMIATWAYRFTTFGFHPVLIEQHPQNQSVLNGSPATFSVQVRASGTVTYQWYRDNAAIPGAISSSYTVAEVREPDQGSIFRCAVTNTEGTVQSANATLDVAESGPVLYLDLGSSALPTTGQPVTWNSLHYNYGEFIPLWPYALAAPDGSPSGVQISAGSGMGEGFADAGPDSGSGFPANAAKDCFWGSSSFNKIEFHLDGLDPRRTYRGVFYASRMGASDNRTSRYFLTGANTGHADLDASNNVTNVTSVTGIKPTAGGRITVKAEKGPANTNPAGYFYIGIVILDVVG